MRLTQYLESQENQDIISISLELKERRDDVCMCPRIKDGCSFYSGWWRIL